MALRGLQRRIHSSRGKDAPAGPNAATTAGGVQMAMDIGCYLLLSNGSGSRHSGYIAHSAGELYRRLFITPAGGCQGVAGNRPRLQSPQPVIPAPPTRHSATLNPSFRHPQPVIPPPSTRHPAALNPSSRRLEPVVPPPSTRHSGASRNLTFAPGQSARQTIQAVWTNPIGGMPQLLCAISAPISRQIRQLIRTKTAAKALDSGLRRNDG